MLCPQSKMNCDKDSDCSRTWGFLSSSKGDSEIEYDTQGIEDEFEDEIEDMDILPHIKGKGTQDDSMVKLCLNIRNPEKWIYYNSDWVRQNLRGYEAKHHPTVEVDEIKINIQPHYEMENNYNPETLKVNAVADVYSWDSEAGDTFSKWEYDFIIKLLPSNTYFRRKKIYLNCIRRERTMIEDILPKLNDFMTNIDHPKRIPVPRLYIAHFEEWKCCQPPKYALGIDINGYEKSSVNRMLGLEQARAAIRYLAWLHGGSYAFCKKFDIVARYPVFSSHTFDPHWELTPVCLKNVIKYLTDIGGHEETVRLMVKGGPKALSILKSRFQKRDDAVMVCLCHGDYRCSHLMFRERTDIAQKDNDKVIRDDIMILDWQQVLIMNPVYDLLFFLYTSTTKTLRSNHLQELLRLYYDSLTSACSPEPFPKYSFEDLCKEVEEKCLFGFIMGICIAHFTLAQASSKMDLLSALSDHLRKAMGKPLFMVNSKSMKRLILGLVSEAEENGNIRRFFCVDNGIRPPLSGRDVRKDWLQHKFKRYGKTHTPSTEYYIQDFQVSQDSKRRRGYDCEFTDISVTTTNYSFSVINGITHEVQVHHLTNKTMPLHQTYNRYREKNDAARKESTMFMFIIPSMNTFQQGRGRDRYCFRSPTIYFYDTEHPDYTLLMQNYKFSGFVAKDKLCGLSLPHVQASLDFLARLHAVSHVFHKEHDLTKTFPVLKNDRFEEFVHNIVSPSLDTVMLLLSRFLTSRQIILKNKKAAIRKVIDEVRSMKNHKFICLCQGDYRTPNLLFRDQPESGEPEPGNDVIVLDWQNIRIRHPVFDILYFLYTSTTPKFRRQNLSRLLQNYHKRLLTIIMELKAPENIKFLARDLPYQEFLDEFNKGRLFGFMMGLCITHICEEYKPVHEELVVQNKNMKVSRRLKQKFQRYNTLFAEAERDGIFDDFYETVLLEDHYGDPSDIVLNQE